MKIRFNGIYNIKTANTKLVELTNLLVGVSEAERSDFDYRMEKCDISVSVEEVIASDEIELEDIPTDTNDDGQITLSLE
jgi:hypothetical protein